MYRNDYYPEYEGKMNFTEELNDLRSFYNERIKESSENISEGFSLLVDQMEDFLKDYREHTKAVDSYNSLMQKMEVNNHCKLNSFINEMKSLLQEEND